MLRGNSLNNFSTPKYAAVAFSSWAPWPFPNVCLILQLRLPLTSPLVYNTQPQRKGDARWSHKPHSSSKSSSHHCWHSDPASPPQSSVYTDQSTPGVPLPRDSVMQRLLPNVTRTVCKETANGNVNRLVLQTDRLHGYNAIFSHMWLYRGSQSECKGRWLSFGKDSGRLGSGTACQWVFSNPFLWGSQTCVRAYLGVRIVASVIRLDVRTYFWVNMHWSALHIIPWK